MRRNGTENSLNILNEEDFIRVKCFIDEGFDFNYESGTLDEFVKLYEAQGSNPKIEDSRGFIMHVASSNGRADILKVILSSAGAEVNLPGRGGNTPLCNAVLKGRLEAVQLLLSYGGVIGSNYRAKREGLHTFCSTIRQEPHKLSIIDGLLKQGGIEDELWGEVLIYALASRDMLLANRVFSDLVAKENFQFFSYNDILCFERPEYRDVYFRAIGNIFDNAEYSEIYTYYVLNDPFRVMSYLAAYQDELSIDDKAIEAFWRSCALNPQENTVDKITNLVLAAMDSQELAEQLEFSRVGKYNPKLASQVMDCLEECVAGQDLRLLTLLLQRKNFIALRNSYHKFNDGGMQKPVDLTLELCEGVSLNLPLQVVPMEGAFYIGNSVVSSADIQCISAYHKGLDALLKPCHLIIGNDGTQVEVQDGNVDQEVSENRVVLYKRKREEVSSSPIVDDSEFDTRARKNGTLRDISAPSSESHREAIVRSSDSLPVKRTFSMT